MPREMTMVQDRSNFFSRQEDWRSRKGLAEIQQLYEGLHKRARFLRNNHTKVSLQMGGIAIRPVTSEAAMTCGGLYRMRDYRLVMLLPVKAEHCSGIRKTRRPYRLHLTQLEPGKTSEGAPAFYSPYRSNEVDFGRNPNQKAPLFPPDSEHICTFDPHSVGGMIEKRRRLTAPIAGNLVVVRSTLWVDIQVLRRKNARNVPVVLYRFRAADFDRVVCPDERGRRVHERFVREGDIVAVLCRKVTYGQAMLTDDGFNVIHRSRDALQLTASGKSWQDYLTVIGCYLLHDMVEEVENKDTNATRVDLLSRSFPHLLGHIPMSPQKIALSPAFSLTPAARAKIVDLCGFGGDSKMYVRAAMPDEELRTVVGVVPSNGRAFFQLRCDDGVLIDVPCHAEVFPEILSGECAVRHGDPIADPVHRQAYRAFAEVLAAAVGPKLMVLAEDDPRRVAAIAGAECVLAESFLDCVAILPGSNWRGEGCLVDLKYVPDDLMPVVREWYFDMREKAEYIDSATGGAVFPLFPRADDLQFHFYVHGLDLDASPLRCHVCVDDSGSNGESGGSWQPKTSVQVPDRELSAVWPSGRVTVR